MNEDTQRQGEVKAKAAKPPPPALTEEMRSQVEAKPKANAPPPTLDSPPPEKRYQLPLPSKHDQLLR